LATIRFHGEAASDDAYQPRHENRNNQRRLFMNALYESCPMTIGKHEWRVIVTPSDFGGNCLEYQWRPSSKQGLPEAMRLHWRSGKEWPRWNGNDTYCGLPRTLQKLYYHEIRELDKHLSRVGKVAAPQMELFTLRNVV
jgi:hypothetical protein